MLYKFTVTSGLCHSSHFNVQNIQNSKKKTTKVQRWKSGTWNELISWWAVAY